MITRNLVCTVRFGLTINHEKPNTHLKHDVSYRIELDKITDLPLTSIRAHDCAGFRTGDPQSKLHDLHYSRYDGEPILIHKYGLDSDSVDDYNFLWGDFSGRYFVHGDSARPGSLHGQVPRS